MFNWFKRYFIPNEANHFRPEFLTGRNLLQVLGVIIGLELLIFIFPTIFFTNFVEDFHLSAVLPGVLTTLTNEERVRQNLPTLVENPVLTKVAELKAEDMASKSYFAHTSPEGKTPWYWFKQAGYRYSIAGENLAVSFSDSQEVTLAWMNSPTHRANIVGRSFKEVGTAVAVGTYKGRESVFVAQVYASPRSGALTGAVSEAPANFYFALASPHQSMGVILFVTLGLVLTALILNIFIKVDRQYPDLVRNGFLGIVFIIGLLFANNYLAREDFETSFIAFDSTVETGEIGE